VQKERGPGKTERTFYGTFKGFFYRTLTSLLLQKCFVSENLTCGSILRFLEDLLYIYSLGKNFLHPITSSLLLFNNFKNTFKTNINSEKYFLKIFFK